MEFLPLFFVSGKPVQVSRGSTTVRAVIRLWSDADVGGPGQESRQAGDFLDLKRIIPYSHLKGLLLPVLLLLKQTSNTHACTHARTHTHTHTHVCLNGYRSNSPHRSPPLRMCPCLLLSFQILPQWPKCLPAPSPCPPSSYPNCKAGSGGFPRLHQDTCLF